MKLNFLDKCVKIATLSTCINNANDDKTTSEAEFQLTNNFKIKTNYDFSYYNSPDVTNELEVHYFDIKFFRDNQFLDHTSFGTYDAAYSCGPLCDKNMKMDIKLEWLKSIKPSIFERVRFMSNKINLSNEEITAIEQLAEKLENFAEKIKSTNHRTK